MPLWKYGARGEAADRRCLEAAEVAPEPGDVAPARIGQLALLASKRSNRPTNVPMSDNASGATERAAQTPHSRHDELRREERGLEIDDIGDDLRGGGRALLGTRHVAGRLVLEPGTLIELAVDQHAVAAVPVDPRAAEGEVDRRHHAPPLHEPGEVREPVRIVHGDEIPLPLGPVSAALEGCALLKVSGKGAGLDALRQGMSARFTRKAKIKALPRRRLASNPSRRGRTRRDRSAGLSP